MIALHPRKAGIQRRSKCLFAVFTILYVNIALSGQSKLAMIEPKQAVMLAAEAQSIGVPGIFSLHVKATGSQDGIFFLNSELDYRDQRNLTIAITPNAMAQIQAQIGTDVRSAFISKQIYVSGNAKRVKINLSDSNGLATDKYYYQTHVPVTNASQIRIGNRQLEGGSQVGLRKLSPPIPPIPPPFNHFDEWIRHDEKPINCGNCANWNTPQAPFKIHGNSYYVGVHGLSVVLITSPKGHVLIDGGLPQSASVIADNIKTLGFDIKDVKWLLNTHAHFDHAGGLAALQRMSGAPVLATSDTIRDLREGHSAKDDPQYAPDNTMPFPAVSKLRAVRSGERLAIADTTITMYDTPGHAPGGGSWSWPSCEAGKCINIVFADSLNSVSDNSYQFSAHPEYISTFRRSIATVRGLKCDILISAHPEFSQLFERFKSNALQDREACKNYAKAAEIRLKKRLAEEAAK